MKVPGLNRAQKYVRGKIAQGMEYMPGFVKDRPRLALAAGGAALIGVAVLLGKDDLKQAGNRATARVKRLSTRAQGLADKYGVKDEVQQIGTQVREVAGQVKQVGSRVRALAGLVLEQMRDEPAASTTRTADRAGSTEAGAAADEVPASEATRDGEDDGHVDGAEPGPGGDGADDRHQPVMAGARGEPGAAATPTSARVSVAYAEPLPWLPYVSPYVQPADQRSIIV